MDALESLADWKGLDRLSMARLLMGMTAEARTDLKRGYAAAAIGKGKMLAAGQQ